MTHAQVLALAALLVAGVIYIRELCRDEDEIDGWSEALGAWVREAGRVFEWRPPRQ